MEKRSMAQTQTQRHEHITALRSPTITTGIAATSRPLSAGAASAAEASIVARGLGAVGLTAIGLIHLLDAPGKYSETPYMFWMYLALIGSCLLGAALLLRANTRLVWVAATALGGMPFIGFVLDRTTGLPGATGDIGNWTEPLGLASLFVEACVVALSLYGLALPRHAPTTP